MVLCACWSFKEILVSKPTKQLIQVGPILNGILDENGKNIGVTPFMASNI